MAQSGIDEIGFEKAYTAYWKDLYRSCLRDTDDAELAKELVQELFRELWERREKVAVQTSLREYLHGALRLKIFEHYRKQAVRMRFAQQQRYAQATCECTTERQVEGRELARHIEQAVDRLAPRCREVYQLSRETGLSNKAIAELLGISEKAVEGNISRALSFLRAKLSVFR